METTNRETMTVEATIPTALAALGVRRDFEQHPGRYGQVSITPMKRMISGEQWHGAAEALRYGSVAEVIQTHHDLIARWNKFDVAKVVQVYSGRRGCACGCRGTYSYAKGRSEIATLRGAKVNDARVRKLTQEVNDMHGRAPEGVELFSDSEHAGYEDRQTDKLVVIHFKE